MTKSKKDGKRRTAFSDECKPPQRREGRLCQTLHPDQSRSQLPDQSGFTPKKAGLPDCSTTLISNNLMINLILKSRAPLSFCDQYDISCQAPNCRQRKLLYISRGDSCDDCNVADDFLFTWSLPFSLCLKHWLSELQRDCAILSLLEDTATRISLPITCSVLQSSLFYN